MTLIHRNVYATPQERRKAEKKAKRERKRKVRQSRREKYTRWERVGLWRRRHFDGFAGCMGYGCLFAVIGTIIVVPTIGWIVAMILGIKNFW